MSFAEGSKGFIRSMFDEGTGIGSRMYVGDAEGGDYSLYGEMSIGSR